MQLLSYWSFRAVLYFSSLLPLSVVRTFGIVLGKLYYRLNLKRVKISRVNIRLCFPALSEQEQERLVKENICAVGQWMFEVGRIWLWPSERLLKLVTVRNEALFFDAVKAGKGVLLSMPHMGNWEVIQPYISTHSEAAGLYKPHKKNPRISDFVRDQRRRDNTELGSTDVGGLRLLMKALAKGKTIVVLPDHNPREEHGVYAPYFGRKVLTTTLIHSMAKRSGAAVFTAVAVRTDGGWELVFEPVPDQHGDDPVTAATAVNRGVEQAIAMAPEQFQWVYPRFRVLEPGEPPAYDFL